jgi:hypothetical protein
MWTDPTPCAIIEARGQNVLAWIQRMLWPRREGEFEAWRTLEPTLMPILHDWAGELFMPWTLANAAALVKPEEEFAVRLRGFDWTQKPQKYHAKSLEALRVKYRAVGDRTSLDPILETAGVLAGLRG